MDLMVSNELMGNDLTMEAALVERGSEVVERAKAMVITSHEEYKAAADMLLGIKAQIKAVKDYWKEPKETAAAAHKKIVAREKAMLDPLTFAETAIKSGMASFQRKMEEERRRAEAEAKRKQMEEAERLLREAAEADANGNKAEAEIGLAMAEMVQDMAPAVAADVKKPEAEGTGVRKVWKARIVNEFKVPAYMGQFELRKIDMSVLNGIARTTKGTAEIPGVEFYEDVTIAARMA